MDLCRVLIKSGVGWMVDAVDSIVVVGIGRFWSDLHGLLWRWLMLVVRNERTRGVLWLAHASSALERRRRELRNDIACFVLGCILDL